VAPIQLYNRGLRGLYLWLLLKAGMWLLRRGSGPWKNRSVYTVDGSRVAVLFTLDDPGVVNTIMDSPSIWLSLETFGDRAKSRWDSLGRVKVDSGTPPIPSISVFTG